MTVGELIAELTTMDPYMTVGAVVSYGREGETELHPLTTLEITGVDQLRAVVILHTGNEI